LGKLAPDALREVLSCIKKTVEVIIPPMPGFDAGAHEIGDKLVMVIATDPCLGVPQEWFGWFLINYSASDVAVFGAPPKFCTINLLGPPRTDKAVFKRIMKQACNTAHEIEMTIITGHTGTYEGLSTIVGTCTAYGTIQKDKLITPGGAKPRDYILCTKPIGLEILVNFALIRKHLAKQLFGSKRALSLAKQVKMQTCVEEALLLARTRSVSAMHDATEGGLVAALNEMADASKVGFRLDFTKLPTVSELQKLAQHFHLSREQVMSMSSTGTLLAAIPPLNKGKAVEVLSKLGLDARIVGVFSKSKGRVVNYDGKEERFPQKADDPYVEIMGT
jgi:hydrogenase maturation factor